MVLWAYAEVRIGAGFGCLTFYCYCKYVLMKKHLLIPKIMKKHLESTCSCPRDVGVCGWVVSIQKITL